MERKDFIKQLAVMPFIIGTMNLNELKTITDNFSPTNKMPVLFIGHGSPMNAILDNSFTRALEKLGKSLEKPNAVLVISAHWQTKGTYVSTNPWPKTIYDFGGFDKKLYEVIYEPKGHPQLAKELINTVTSLTVNESVDMGLDHGAWTILKHIFPDADVPVFELSIDFEKSPSFHYSFGQELQKLREKGVLIIGSGNIVHNLRLLDWHNTYGKPFDWAMEFDLFVKNSIDKRDFQPLVEYQKFGKAAQLSVPTNDHYLPMMYTLGLANNSDPITYIYEGYEYGSLSMRCFKVG
jgi:4,5-DOPA dioxygenase extradiol